jgi:hypothetical protein
VENLNASNCVEDLSVYGRIILQWVSKRTGGISWFYLAQGRDIWWDKWNVVIILMLVVRAS